MSIIDHRPLMSIDGITTQMWCFNVVVKISVNDEKSIESGNFGHMHMFTQRDLCTCALRKINGRCKWNMKSKEYCVLNMFKNQMVGTRSAYG